MDDCIFCKIVRGEVPSAIRKSMEMWVGCIAGALTEADYRSKLAKAGFTDINVEVTRVYGVEAASTFLAGHGLDVLPRRRSMARSVARSSVPQN